MPPILANAFPRKSFFVQMFTKDISLEDCVLDLIDNSIDGLVISRELRLSEITNAIWSKGRPRISGASLPVVRVELSESFFPRTLRSRDCEWKSRGSAAYPYGETVSWIRIF